MPLVSIGVPVYNGASMIGECLDCLTKQTLADLDIVVSDNASTDTTAEIVEAFAARDARVRLIRQSTNIGLMKNFKAVADAATSPYFIMRCHDDQSSLNYTEALLKGLQQQEGAKLAVGTVETLRGGKVIRTLGLPRQNHKLPLMNISELLFRSHAAWFCGLWDYAAFKPAFDRVWARYDSPWGPDHLTLYPFLVAQQVALVPEAKFIQRITPKVGDAKYAKPDIPAMKRLRATFMDLCETVRREQGITGTDEVALAAMTWLYTGKRVYKARNIWRHTLVGQ